MSQIDRNRLRQILIQEEERFAAIHPKSKALAERARRSLLAGVPMNWMVRWAGTLSGLRHRAKGAHFRCVDGHDYIDFCLGDTGAMTGHAPEAAMEAITDRIRTRRHLHAADGRCLVGRRGAAAPIWPGVLADGANGDRRQSFRAAPCPCGDRPAEDPGLQLVLSWHGRRTFITLENGRARPRPGNTGPQVDPDRHHQSDRVE
jgi:glutamate-1-semialdehyde 2,1-aminomutase